MKNQAKPSEKGAAAHAQQHRNLQKQHLENMQKQQLHKEKLQADMVAFMQENKEKQQAELFRFMHQQQKSFKQMPRRIASPRADRSKVCPLAFQKETKKYTKSLHLFIL